MCQENNSKKKIATKDIVCWKVLNKDGSKLSTVFQDCTVHVGKCYRSRITFFDGSIGRALHALRTKKEMSKKEVKVLLDRTFNSWDSFIRRLDKEKWACADLLRKYSYKSEFMNNDELRRIYETL